MNRLAFLIVLPLLAGCNVHSKNPANDDENVSLSADQNGQVAFNFPFAKGSIKLPASMMHNGELDLDGVKMPAGTSTTGFHMNSANNETVLVMNFTNPGTPEQVRSYFVDAFAKKGMTAKIDGDSVTGRSKDGSPFTIAVTPAGAGSQGQIVVHSKD
ncbi:MAG TPA: hypothetical protein VN713_04135 [Sphingomicrobium sp.]|nr:hypothetical protein [Sphingomicrobium sp.]